MGERLFWLSDRQWVRIEPYLPTGLPGPARDDDRRIISGIIHVLQSGARWRDCPPEYVHTRRSTIASTAGPNEADGVRSLKLWRSSAKTPSRCRSTPPRSRLIAAPPVEKGGAKSGHRPLARWAHQDPRAERSALPASRPSPDPRPRCRHYRGARCPGARATHVEASRRQGL